MKASEIDWSKAPEGATHFGPENEEWHEAWYKLDGYEWFAMPTSDDDQWDFAPQVYDGRVSQMIQRPAEWNGTGLPPVGTVCEVNHHGWRRCEVFAHKVEGDKDPDVLFSHTNDNGGPAWNWAREPSRFRPIRTPKQIEAEERERAVDAMMQTFAVNGSEKSFLRHACLALYDAGYRKVEGDKQ